MSMQRCIDFECSKPETCSCRMKINFPLICITGAARSGKYTQGLKIVERFNFAHLHISDILRSEATSGSKIGKEIQTCLDNEELCNNDDVLHLLELNIYKNKNSVPGIIINGFPKELNQGKKFEKYIAPIDKIIYLKVSNEILKHRFGDKPAEERVKRFQSMISAVLSHFADKIITINGDQSIEQIFDEIQVIVKNLIEVKKDKLNLQEKVTN